MMHPKPQVLHLPQIFLVVTSAFVLHDYNQAGLSALLDLPQVVRYFTQVDTINIAGAEEVRNSTIKGFLLATRGPCGCSVLSGNRTLGRRKSIFIAGLLALVGQSPNCRNMHMRHKKKKKRRDFSSLVKLRFLRDAQPYLVLGGYP